MLLAILLASVIRLQAIHLIENLILFHKIIDSNCFILSLLNRLRTG